MIVERIDMPKVQLTQAEEQQTRKSLFLGITLWFLHFNILNALISVSCKWGGLTVPVGGLSGLQLLSAALSLIAILGLLYLIYLAWRNWRSLQSKPPPKNPRLLEETDAKRQALMAFVAMGLNGFLAVYVLATFITLFSLKACGQA
jgi:hypothetical protein